MNFLGTNVLASAAACALALTGMAIVMAFIRLVRGPSLSDRVIALDLIGILALGMVAAIDIALREPVLLDAATVLALVAFLGTVAFARYVERKARDG